MPSMWGGIASPAMSSRVGAISAVITALRSTCFLTPGPLTNNGTLISESYGCRLSQGRP